jgi:transcription antitermination factor NusG
MFPNKQWCAFYTECQRELTAGDEILELGFETFVPTQKRLRRLPSGRVAPRETALFPRYGFVRFSLQFDYWWPIVEARSVIDLLRHDKAPARVPDQAIDILQLAQRVGIFDHTKPPAVGVGVQITAGPFAGFLGKIIRARTGDRMDVLLKMFASETVATIPLTALKEVTA